jgi:hypothetical protein
MMDSGVSRRKKDIVLGPQCKFRSQNTEVLGPERPQGSYAFVLKFSFAFHCGFTGKKDSYPGALVVCHTYSCALGFKTSAFGLLG